MQASRISYPVWHILPGRVADKPDSVRAAIQFLANHKFFHLEQTHDARHLMALFTATDLAASGLSHFEILQVISYQNSHPLLFVEQINAYNCYDTLKQALFENNADVIADCLIFLLNSFKNQRHYIPLPDEYPHPETEILIRNMRVLAQANLKMRKSNNKLKIQFKAYSPIYETYVRYLSTFVPVELSLGDVFLTEDELKNLRDRLPYLTLTA